METQNIPEVRFKDWNCIIHKGFYSNGRIALQLLDPEDGGLIATATINLVHEDIDKGEVIIKNYSENEGMYDALREAGVISPMKRVVKSGFITAPVCDLLV